MYVYVLYHNTQGTKWKLNKCVPGSRRRPAQTLAGEIVTRTSGKRYLCDSDVRAPL